jgi:hypothetical protein
MAPAQGGRRVCPRWVPVLRCHDGLHAPCIDGNARSHARLHAQTCEQAGVAAAQLITPANMSSPSLLT